MKTIREDRLKAMVPAAWAAAHAAIGIVNSLKATSISQFEKERTAHKLISAVIFECMHTCYDDGRDDMEEDLCDEMPREDLQ